MKMVSRTEKYDLNQEEYLHKIVKMDNRDSFEEIWSKPAQLSGIV